MSERDVQALLRSGIEEARLGHVADARATLREVVRLDPDNEKGWLWLASVTEEEAEKASYLEKALALNPDNESARRALDKIQERRRELAHHDEVMPGVSRRTLSLAIGLGAVAVILVIAALAFSTVNNNRRAEDDSAATGAALDATRTQDAAALALVATETALQEVAAVTEDTGPTATPTSFRPARTPVPTWTPTFTPPPPSGPETLARPEGLTGTLSGWSGRDIQSIDFLPVGVFDLSTGAFRASGSGVGRDARLHPNGQRIAYTRYDQVLFSTMIEMVNMTGADAEPLSSRWQGESGPLEVQMPDYSPDGSRVVFVGKEPNSDIFQLYMVNLAATGGAPALRRLTNDRANYSYPALSPDGARIAVVRDDPTSPAPGADIIIIDVETLALSSLTTDAGTFVETAPRWSPDGQQIVYAAAPASEPGNSDIALRHSGGFGLPVLPVRGPADDIFPVFSPDGRYLAFASNRSGAYDIYILDITRQTLAQLTATADEDYPGSWR